MLPLLNNRVTTTLALVILLLMGGIVWTSQTAHAAKAAPLSSYDCRSHCYALTTWQFIAHTLTGAKSTMLVSSLSCPPSRCYNGGGDPYHIGDTMWLIDEGTEGPSCWMYLCWVEVGDVSFTYSTSDTRYYYYWADNRPGIENYHIHYDQTIADDIGETSNLYINQASSNSWSVSASSYTYGTGISDTSRSNAMVPDHIEVGLELFDYTTGANPASAGTSHFTNNQWINGSSYYYENIQENDTVDPPAYGNWDVLPENSSTGGNWRTSCGC
jgi:hypothetical protein